MARRPAVTPALASDLIARSDKEMASRPHVYVFGAGHVGDALAGSSFVILTHDHALDFLIAAEALKRPDAAYVGMIGSKTKRATFKSWLLREIGNPDLFENLVCPIGGTAIKDTRPTVIAALATAEIMTAALIWSTSPVNAAKEVSR